MKLFNWMHRKLHPSAAAAYSHVSDKQPKDTFIGVEDVETEDALLLHNVFDGILTIGTLGLGLPAVNVLRHQDCGNAEEDEHPREEEEEEEGEDAAAFVQIIRNKSLNSSTGEKENEKKSNLAEAMAVAKIAQPEQHCHYKEELMKEPLLKKEEEEEEKEKGRTTLADLFAAADKGAINKEKTSKKTDPMIQWKSKKTKELENEKKKKQKKKEEEEEELLSVATATNIATTKRVRSLLKKLVKKKIHPEALGSPETESKMHVQMKMISLISQSKCIEQSWRKN